ncbi:D-glycerate dehydrogenase [candidate division WOR-3 bacterium]|nr:D-glycerate dehydrogenase [candidate division WOR-3 bacterium]
MAEKPKVLLTRLLPQDGIDLLEKHVELEINPEDKIMPKEKIIDKIKDKDGLICLLTDKIDTEIIDAGENLKIIANYAVGFNNIDVEETTKRNIPVTNTPGVLTETTADLVFALILSTARKIVEADRFLRGGKFKGWAPMLFLGNDVYNKTLGIIGFGRIGRAVAQRAKGFHMKIIYHEPVRLSHDIEKEYNTEYKNFGDLLKESDFITIHTPLVESTHHLISEKEFSLMKKTAYLINAARGPIVDEKALVEALKERKIAGCALDVFEREPDVEKELITIPNTILVPHIGSASIETRTKMALIVAENVIAVLVNKTRPPNIVNSEIYK